MICPNCKNESNGTRWCAFCGIQLETDDAANTMYAQSSKPETSYETKNTESYTDNTSCNHSKPYTHAPDFNELNEDSGNKKLKITLAIVCPITAVVMIFVILTMSGLIKFGTARKTSDTPNQNVVLEKEDADTLMKTGMNHLKIGDYEEAETVFMAVMEIAPDNREATTLCQIVYNYNRALKKIQSKKYKEARVFFDKIPLEYMDYEICDDVENLEYEITQYETTYTTFSNLKSYMQSGNYKDAMEMFAIIDERYLEDSNIELLTEYRQQIDNHIREEEDEQERKSTEDADLSFKRAEILITEYCEDYVRAINSKDFSIVAKHLNGQLYDQQKKQVQSCIDSGITESLDSVSVNNLSKLSENKWKAGVTEAETIYYADGTSKSKTFEWTYTIEYIDSVFYLTKIE